ncbi:outer membrane lipoprotein carrier protein LolA [Fluviicola sp.]|jgi:outer membrane lipoprotein carrier protein|uniref:LolA family protein n=1 Tax=Fluviicola sp. TaxID=1917219 RepID=UPI00281FDC88|nr:outer membrane lipoprotein carrier protein LolA [Fluviicola sp.]MDR0801470.1 outer membrane lipoprotein carrier protein LolA [Fluviicola sp.]
MKFTISFFILLFGSPVFAQEYTKISDPKACKEALEKQHREIKSIQADFLETAFSPLLSTPQKGSGKMYYKKENKIRWEKSKPESQIILINGKEVKLQENGKEVNSTSSKMIVKKIQQLMVQMMTGDFLNETDFKISYYENKLNYKLILTPKSDKMKRYIAEISLIFTKEELLLKELTMKQNDTDKLIYSFSNMQQNGAINDSKFTTF